MPVLYLLIGSNQGDRRQLLLEATDLIRERIGSVVACSKMYETAPWGQFTPDETPQSFYNQALAIDTTLPPLEALREALEIERLLGRRRNQIHPPRTYSSRPIDIDLIFYGRLVLETPTLTLPHPRMHLRRFVLQPLCDIAHEWVHPIMKKTVKQLLNECPDTSSCSCC